MREKDKDRMIDNRRVKDDHQEGISRVLQRPGDLTKGQGGKMGDKHGEWRKGPRSIVPRQA